MGIKRRFKEKKVIVKGIGKVNLYTSPYSVLATAVNGVAGIGKFPSDAIKDLRKRMKK